MPLPDAEARLSMIKYKLKEANVNMTDADFVTLGEITEGYSCADLQSVVKEAAMIPVRELPTEQLMNLKDTTAIRAI